MNKITIDYKKATTLIETFENSENVERIKAPTLMNKLSLKAKEYAMIYFHSGAFDKEAVEAIKNAKVVIATSKKSKAEIVKQTQIDKQKIKVVYPSINEAYLKEKESKAIVSKQFNFDAKRKIILFTAKNFKQNGAKEFCDIVQALHYNNIQVIIAGDEPQITQLKFQASKYGFSDEVLLIENYPNMNILFSAADIFILPTHITGFSSNVLKAMFFKTAVFVSANCASSEVVDVFSTLNFPDDRATPFKVDALLGNKEEMKSVKKQNKKASKRYVQEKQIEKLFEIARKI